MKVFIYEENGVRGSGIRGETDKLFIIQKGSGAVGDHKVKKSLNWSERSKLRKELISNGTLTKSDDHYRFQKDHTFNSPSQAASIICGNNRNGNIFTLSHEIFPIDSERISTSSHEIFPIDNKPILHEIFPIDSERAMEGYKKDLQLYVSERNAKLAERRKKQDDYTCQACGFKLEVSGHFVIECHHINPISLGERQTGLDDLVSLCPTCHRIAHTREPIYQVEEIASIRQDQTQQTLLRMELAAQFKGTAKQKATIPDCLESLETLGIIARHKEEGTDRYYLAELQKAG